MSVVPYVSMSQPIPANELHETLAQAYSDLFKEANGIRPRWTPYGDLSTDELGQMVLELQAEAKAEAEHEAMEERADERQALADAAAACPYMDEAEAFGCAGW